MSTSHGTGAIVSPDFQHSRMELKLAAQEFFELAAKALTIKAIAPWPGSDAFIAQARADWAGDEAEATERLITAASGAHDRIRAILGRLSIYLDDAVRTDVADRAVSPHIGPFLRREIARLDGYIDGVYRSGSDRSTAAASGRKNIGDQTDRRIAGLVQPYRAAGVAKAEAARQIVNKSGLTYESLLKRLSKMYPGDSWSEPKPGS